MRSRKVEPGRGGDTHADPVGKHLRAAGDGRAVAAGFANDRRRFAGDRGFVDRSHALDHLAVGRNDVAGFTSTMLSTLSSVDGNQSIVLRIARAGNQLGLRLGALPPQRFGLSLAAPFGDRFREIGEQNREPQPQNDLKFEADMFAAGREIADQDHSRQRSDNLRARTSPDSSSASADRASRRRSRSPARRSSDQRAPIQACACAVCDVSIANAPI